MVESPRDPDRIFDVHYERLHAAYLTAEQSDWDVEEICRLLPVEVSSVLDAPCGWGRIANRLAYLGYDVVGVDRSARWIAQAIELGGAAKRRPRFAVADLATFTPTRRVDAVVCWFNSFGYGDDRANAALLGTFADALAPGGTLLVNTLAVEVIEQAFVDGPHVERQVLDGVHYVETTTFDRATAQLSTRREVDGVHTATASVRLYEPSEWRAMLDAAGFRDVTFERRVAASSADAEAEVTVKARRVRGGPPVR